MGKLFEEIDDRLADFIGRQHMFFVATAPLSEEGRVNLSPKGLDSFAILGPRQVAYLDLVGSGAETLAHLRENGRITVMFCAFEGAPKILRLYGTGTALEPGDSEFPELAGRFPEITGARAIVQVELTRIADSCGYGVPSYHFEGDRPQMEQWAQRKGPAGLREYQRAENLSSIDGLPALRGETLGPRSRE